MWDYGFLVFFLLEDILMDDFALFVCGVVVTLVAGMGVITSEVFLGYYKYLEKERLRQLKKAQKQLQLEEQKDGTLEQTV